ncbi:MAG: Uma2 family endonuclease [Oscillatoria sp. PMC 1068.18]|nr:Uma2 family endonuclease [Oscillatoria sp. PMC 1076.18]MEC4990513.1 Uma2 family endonuclease [Oscillatoria sp. PMC 1068.18]
MVQIESASSSKIIYPDSDGQPMADNTKQYRTIVWIHAGIEALFKDDPDVFVAADLLWYPVEGNNTLRRAPDVMVAMGRPKGDRGSYQQWLENNLPPQVVFEILSPGNTLREMAAKLQFYDRYGVEEYYLYDPDTNDLTGWLRRGKELQVIEGMIGWVSPRLGIRFGIGTELELYYPNGERFATYLEVLAQLESERQRVEQERERVEQERQRVEQERQRVEQERQRAEQERQRAEQAETLLKAEQRRSEALAARLRAMGIDPDQL